MNKVTYWQLTNSNFQIIQIGDRYGIQYFNRKTGMWCVAYHKTGKYAFVNMDYLQCMIVCKVYFNSEVKVQA